MLRAPKELLLLFGCAALPALGCSPIEHEQITAADLAKVLPVFATLEPDLPIAPAPMPGAHRILRASELAALARRNSVPAGEFGDQCFEWPMESLDRGRVIEAMRKALSYPDVHLEVLETSIQPVPRGQIEFRREDLGSAGSSTARTPVMWRGRVIYGGDHTFSIWARVIVSALLPRVVAAGSIPAGTAIPARLLRQESREVFPAAGDVAEQVADVIGRTSIRAIAPGQEIHLANLKVAADVNRGDSVQVEVRSGSAKLGFIARAEADGRSGDVIPLRNPTSKKIFQARVEGRDRAFIDLRNNQGN